MLLNTTHIAELIEKADFSSVREAMDASLAEGSQTFEQDLARLIRSGQVSRQEGLAWSDSPTNLLWRLDNQKPSAAGKPPETGHAAITALPELPCLPPSN